MDMCIPPAHDSPNNILNALDDFCIQEILRRLKSVDFFNASMTCKRFHENAKMCFPIIFQPDTFIVIEKPTKVDDVQYILNMFGRSIKKLRWIASGDRRIDSKIFEVISNASSPRITCLRICIHRIYIECWNEPIPRVNPGLEHLDIEGFEPFSTKGYQRFSFSAKRFNFIRINNELK